MNQVDAHQVYQRLWKTSHELPDSGRVALFDEEKSELVILNGVGAAVWQRLDGKSSVASIIKGLVAEVEQAPSFDQAEKEVLIFLRDLINRRAIAPLDV